MRITDYHIHTSFSPDSSMKPADAVQAAIHAGMTDICFTEHMDLGHHLDSYNRIPDFQQMYACVQQLRAAYPQLRINLGIEAGYISSTAAQTAQVLSQQKLDYVLLSTHCVDGLDCVLPESRRNRDKPTAYRRYLETVLESLEDARLTDHYDCVGHIGYIAKCGHYPDSTFPYAMFPNLFDAILSRIIKNEKGLEVNTSGLPRAGHVLPHPSILSRYLALGGRIVTLGSDAHTPERVGSDIRKTAVILSQIGFKEITFFSNRNPEFHRITLDESPSCI